MTNIATTSLIAIRSTTDFARKTNMKAIVGLIAATVTLSAAGAAFAADPSHVDVTGQAPGICTLPTSWTAVSSNGGASNGQFGGTTWNIPGSALAVDGNAVTGGAEYAIRIRGKAFCNTSHTISLTSANGGLVAGGDPAAQAAPAGFDNRRGMSYQAHWYLGTGTPIGTGNDGLLGPRVSLNATAATRSAQPASYVVGPNLVPPGDRSFDIRMGVVRNAAAGPLIAGVYSDSITVTLSPAP